VYETKLGNGHGQLIVVYNDRRDLSSLRDKPTCPSLLYGNNINRERKNERFIHILGSAHRFLLLSLLFLSMNLSQELNEDMIRGELRAVRIKKANIGEHYRDFILLTCVCFVFVTNVCMYLCACMSSMCEIFARKVGKDEGMMDRERQRIRYTCVRASVL